MGVVPWHPQDGGIMGSGFGWIPGTVEEIFGRAGHRKVDSDGLLRSRALVPPRAILRLRRLVHAREGDQVGTLDVDETALLLLGQAAGGIVEAKGGPPAGPPPVAHTGKPSSVSWRWYKHALEFPRSCGRLNAVGITPQLGSSSRS